jgi:hypothetical protein
MGVNVLIATMGEQTLWEAAALLKLPYTELTAIARHLIVAFCKTYPRLKGVGYAKLYGLRGQDREAPVRALFEERTWYAELIREIELTGRLHGWTGFTREIHGDPRENKKILNEAVAHGPQSLVAMIVNDAFFEVWRTMSSNLFWPVAQVHDEILVCYKAGHEHLLDEVGRIMSKPVIVHGKSMVIPPDVPKVGTKYWVET